MFVQPYCTLHGLAHLDALAGGQQLEGQAVSRFLFFSSDQVNTAQNVGPLVVSAKLHLAAVQLVQFQEIVGLHQHVVELEERQSSFHSLFVALCSQHFVD